MAGRERSRVKLLHHKCTCSSTCFCKKGKQWLEREGEGGLVALAWRWQEMEKVVQDACSYSKKMFVAPLPFHLSLIKPSLRRGQVKRCPGPWVEIGLTSWIVYTSIHTYIRMYSIQYTYTVVCGKMSVRPNMHSLKYNDIVPADVLVKANTPIWIRIHKKRHKIHSEAPWN